MNAPRTRSARPAQGAHWRLLHELILAPDVTLHEAKVYTVLCAEVDEHGSSARMRRDEIAALAGIGLGQASHALTRLQKRGIARAETVRPVAATKRYSIM
ncbi:MAG TPA: hypothetical protein PJ986_10620 [Gammaproteobacteria bacterium]|nr:hypothetical protein [Gammaproteobacteria bacterium]